MARPRRLGRLARRSNAPLTSGAALSSSVVAPWWAPDARDVLQRARTPPPSKAAWQSHRKVVHQQYDAVLILQRRRWMDAAAQAQGPSHGRALQLQSSPMQFVTPHTCAGVTNRSRLPSLSTLEPAGARARVPEARWHKVAVLSPIQDRSSWNYPVRENYS